MDIISFNEAATANSRIESFIENPDSTSGIVTVPKTIASGETITIPAGRVAILPNVQIDGTLNIDGEVFIPSGSTFGDLDAQLGLKADTSYVSTQLGLKANTADLKEIGVGQTWQNVTASRASGVTYTNSTGKPIEVKVIWGSTAMDTDISLFISLLRTREITYTRVAGAIITMSAIVPNGSTYRFEPATSGSINIWLELR